MSKKKQSFDYEGYVKEQNETVIDTEVETVQEEVIEDQCETCTLRSRKGNRLCGSCVNYKK